MPTRTGKTPYDENNRGRNNPDTTPVGSTTYKGEPGRAYSATLVDAENGKLPDTYQVANNKVVPVTLPAIGWGGAQDQEKARQLRDALLAQQSALQNRAAPQVGPAPTVTAAQAGPAATAQAPSLGPMERPQAVFAAAPQSVNADRVHEVYINPIERVKAAQIAQAQQARSQQANAAQIDTGQQNQFRNQQMDLLSALTASANGTGGPSAAQMQLQKGVDQAIAVQRAQAAGAHGTGTVTANLQAANNIGTLTQTSAADAAILRANEQQQARQQLLAGLQGARATDVDLATSQAGFQNATNLTNAQLGTSVNLANAHEANVVNMTQAQLQQQAAMGNAAAQNELNSRQAAIAMQAQTANQDAGLRAAMANQGAGLQTSLANAGYANQANIVGAQEANRGNLAGADMQLRAGLANAGFQNQTALANAGFQNQAGLANADMSFRGGVANAGLSQQQMSIDDQRRMQALQAALQAQGQVLGVNQSEAANEIARQGLAQAKTASERSFWSNLLGVGLGVGGAVAGAIFGGPAGAVAGGTAGKVVGDATSQYI